MASLRCSARVAVPRAAAAAHPDSKALKPDRSLSPAPDDPADVSGRQHQVEVAEEEADEWALGQRDPSEEGFEALPWPPPAAPSSSRSRNSNNSTPSWVARFYSGQASGSGGQAGEEAPAGGPGEAGFGRACLCLRSCRPALTCRSFAPMRAQRALLLCCTCAAEGGSPPPWERADILWEAEEPGAASAKAEQQGEQDPFAGAAAGMPRGARSACSHLEREAAGLTHCALLLQPRDPTRTARTAWPSRSGSGCWLRRRAGWPTRAGPEWNLRSPRAGRALPHAARQCHSVRAGWHKLPQPPEYSACAHLLHFLPLRVCSLCCSAARCHLLVYSSGMKSQ